MSDPQSKAVTRDSGTEGAPAGSLDGMVRPSNIDLGKTQITPDILVSSAAIFYDEWFGKRWQVETWIFSHDARQLNVQVIHGSSSYCGGNPPHETLVAKCKRVHERISTNLRARYCAA